MNLIFDLDGTLVDSLPGIEASTRFSLSMFSPMKELPPMRSVIGPPIGKMFARLWPDLTAAQLGELVARFRKHYDATGCRLSQLYPGVLDTLQKLKAREDNLFVLTNKPLRASHVILDHLGVLSYFTELVSPDRREPAFLSKTDGARYLVDKYYLDKGSTVLVGDGLDDFAAADACGFVFIEAAYGYGGISTAGPRSWPVAKTFPNILDSVL